MPLCGSERRIEQLSEAADSPIVCSARLRHAAIVGPEELVSPIRQSGRSFIAVRTLVHRRAHRHSERVPGVNLPFQSGHGILLVVFAVVLIAPRMARLVRVPDLVGLIIGGVIVGPHGLALIEREGTVENLGTAGLLYLMFQAGLELDPDDFRAHRTSAVVFGALTFSIPFAIGVFLHQALGFTLIPALLLASCWGSHTLLTYPQFQHARAVSNRAVSIGVAGTVVTDTVALLLLVALVRAHEGELTAASIAIQVPMMAAACAAIIVGLPRITRWFFSGIGRDRATRFVFVMVALYGSSLLAEVVGVEPILGAFLAGMAINRAVAEGSDLDDQVHRFGSLLLIPVFLVSVGMLIDPATALLSARTLMLAGVFTLTVVGGKSLAAVAAARIQHLDGAETIALIALSVPQAAATLAAVFVGFEVGLIEQDVVDAAVLVILATCLIGTVAARHAIHILPTAPRRSVAIGRRIIVPVAPGELDEPTIELAAALGRRDAGIVLPLSVLELGSSNAQVTALREELVATAEQVALANGCDARSIVRLDMTPASGLVHTAVETGATLVLLTWDGERTGRHDRFSHTADTLLDLANTPVIITRAGNLEHYRRVVLRLDTEDILDRATSKLGADQMAMTELVWLIGSRLSNHLKIPLVLCSTAALDVLDKIPHVTSHVNMIENEAAAFTAGADDLVIRPLNVVELNVVELNVDELKGVELKGVESANSTLWVARPRSARDPAIAPAADVAR